MVGLLGMLPRPICSGTSAWRPLTSRCLVGQPSLPLWKRMYAARPEKLETNAQEEETMEMATDKSEGSIIATQSGLFKLLLPLPVPNKKETENVLFLLHPRQTLSHVATLVRSELLAANAGARHASSGTTSTPAQTAGSDDFNEITFHGQFRNPANLNDATGSSGKFKIASKWALSTEFGDFVKDATRHRQFSIEISPSVGSAIERKPIKPQIIPVKVPTFEQRTHFLRAQLRKVSSDVNDLLELKKECDLLAYRDARRMGFLGLAGLGVYWFGVYWLTFKVWDWDVMEPITYLCGLTTVGAGYAWFLHKEREVSYQSVFELSTSRRKQALYDQKGFERERWQDLVDEATNLRRTIQAIARDYDVNWSLKDERGDHADLEQEMDKEEDSGDKSHKKHRGHDTKEATDDPRRSHE